MDSCWGGPNLDSDVLWGSGRTWEQRTEELSRRGPWQGRCDYTQLASPGKEVIHQRHKLPVTI